MAGLMKRLRSTTGGPEIGPGPSKKVRLVNGIKMLLDIAKESADACPPLKSCLGGITALIRHYEESKDVQDKLGDLIPWLIKLKGSVTTGSAGGSREEAERREEFIRALDEIDNQSQALLGKGRAAQILDKAQDSGVVVNLIEQLRRAILLYQLSQQQSIDNQVTKLAISFAGFLQLRETARGVREKVESTLERLGRLDFGEGNLEDEAESKRRMVLLEDQGGITSHFRTVESNWVPRK
ncbi:hypothetical protein BJ322DRAFT_855846 [Thelephora terrestris]|uniref:Uncharacterized protein n=1 Tax=Thelephora terrestris TaxID=56493 RepID=A0A9P6L6Q0_9AGAM|nr:hypothetical protein BJ322DRAFT_855846 [Thelephora terrestris]